MKLIQPSAALYRDLNVSSFINVPININLITHVNGTIFKHLKGVKTYSIIFFFATTKVHWLFTTKEERDHNYKYILEFSNAHQIPNHGNENV